MNRQSNKQPQYEILAPAKNEHNHIHEESLRR